MAFDTGRTKLAVSQLTEVKLFDVDATRLDKRSTRIDDPSAVRAVTFSSDGTRVITGGADGARIWDLETGKLLATRDDHNVINGLAMDKDTLWTASEEDHTVDAWDVRVEDGVVSTLARFVARHGPWRLDDHDNLIRALRRI